MNFCACCWDFRQYCHRYYIASPIGPIQSVQSSPDPHLPRQAKSSSQKAIFNLGINSRCPSVLVWSRCRIANPFSSAVEKIICCIWSLIPRVRSNNPNRIGNCRRFSFRFASYTFLRTIEFDPVQCNSTYPPRHSLPCLSMTFFHSFRRTSLAEPDLI